MLDVDRRPNIYTGIEQFFDILPALGVPAVGRIGVSEFIDNDEFRLARQGSVDVEFLDDSASILNLAARQNLETFGQAFGFLSSMRLDETDEDIDAVHLQGARPC